MTGTAGRGATRSPSARGSGCDSSCAASSAASGSSMRAAVGWMSTTSAIGGGTASAVGDGTASAVGGGTASAVGDGTASAVGGGTGAAGRAVHSEQRQTAFSLPVSRHRLASYHAANIQLMWFSQATNGGSPRDKRPSQHSAWELKLHLLHCPTSLPPLSFLFPGTSLFGFAPLRLSHCNEKIGLLCHAVSHQYRVTKLNSPQTGLCSSPGGRHPLFRAALSCR